MKRAVCHIVTALVLGSLLLSCSGRVRIIPRSTLADIYADMLLADQWIKDNPTERKVADTTLFYDPIFARYGYTFEDYDATVKKYMQDPEKFSKVFRAAGEKLQKRGAVYGKIAARIRDNRKFNELFLNFNRIDFDADSLLWSPDTAARDTFALDSLALDSLRRDSLRIDSLARVAFVADSLRRDSLRKDALIRRHLVSDSLRRVTRRRDTVSRRRGPDNPTLMIND